MITWASQKQKFVTLSSYKAGYIATATAACQGVWLSRLLGELVEHEQKKVKLLVDNKSAIALCKNPVHHERSKHIDTHFYFIRQYIKDGIVDVDHVGTNGQLADILTKELGRVKFIEMRKLSIVEVNSMQQD